MAKQISLAVQILVVFSLVYIAGINLSDRLRDEEVAAQVESSEPSRVDGVIDAFLPSDERLQVLPAQGDPTPIDYNLQGSAPSEQQTQDNLQPQSLQQLQPNAGADALPLEGNILN